MKRQLLYLSVGMDLILSTSCCKKGCKDIAALNYDVSADKDDHSCRYTTVTFYAAYGYYSGIPITQISLKIDGETRGNITSIFPNGPGNCSATGTVAFELPSSESFDWNTTVYLANGAIVYGSGTVKANSYSECTKVNVTQ
jgi:hypothetical protein